MDDFVWVFVRPDNPYNLAMIPPSAAKEPTDWLGYLLVLLMKFV